MDFSKTKPSKNFIDQTGDDYRNSLDWTWLLGIEALKQANIDPKEALKGLTPQQINEVLFRRAWDAHGGTQVDDIRLGFPYKSKINTINKWEPSRSDWIKAFRKK